MKGIRALLGMVLAVMLALVPFALAFAYAQPPRAPSPAAPLAPRVLCGLTDEAAGQAVLPQATQLPHPGKAQPTPHQTPRTVLQQRQFSDAASPAEQPLRTALRPDAERCYAAHPHHAPPAAA